MKAHIKVIVRIIILVITIQMLFSICKDIVWFFYDIGSSNEHNIFYNLGIILGADIAGLAILFVLWWKTNWLARILASNMDENTLIINTSNVDLITVAIRIIGIYLVVTSIPNFVGLVVNHIQISVRYPGYDLSEYLNNELEPWVITIVKLLLGLWLALGSKWLVRRLKGNENSEQTKDNEEQSKI